MKLYCCTEIYNFLDPFLFCFVYKLFAVTIMKGRFSMFSHGYFDIFEEKAVQSPVFLSLLQVYIVNRVSFIFRLSSFLESVCTKGLTFCFADRREGEQDQHVRGVRFMNFTTFCCFICFYLFIFMGNVFNTTFTHTHTHTRDPRSLAHSFPDFARRVQLNVVGRGCGCGCRGKCLG